MLKNLVAILSLFLTTSLSADSVRGGFFDDGYHNTINAKAKSNGDDPSGHYNAQSEFSSEDKWRMDVVDVAVRGNLAVVVVLGDYIDSNRDREADAYILYFEDGGPGGENDRYSYTGINPSVALDIDAQEELDNLDLNDLEPIIRGNLKVKDTH